MDQLDKITIKRGKNLEAKLGEHTYEASVIRKLIKIVEEQEEIIGILKHNIEHTQKRG